MKNKAELLALLHTYIANQCTPEEVETLMSYFNSTQASFLEEELLRELEQPATKEEAYPALPPRVFAGIRSRIAAKPEAVKRFLWPRIAIAAAVVVVAFSTGLWFFSKEKPVVEQNTSVVKDIEPAGNKAYLVLGNGQRITLAESREGNIATQGSVNVAKTADGQLSYSLNKGGSINEQLLYNTLEVPNGGKYHVSLPDGTRVWVNAGSTLRFPISFASVSERRVTLTGEAYFEVAHDKIRPFKVISANQTVEVLGTHFNVNAYANESAIKTTLIEGSVKVGLNNSRQFTLLRPMQQARLQHDQLTVTPADLDQVMAWKNGDFVFNGEDIKTVMRQIARWYDVEIEYLGEVSASGVVSTISRTKKLSQLLKALEANQQIRFKIEGRRVLVMP